MIRPRLSISRVLQRHPVRFYSHASRSGQRPRRIPTYYGPPTIAERWYESRRRMLDWFTGDFLTFDTLRVTFRLAINSFLIYHLVTTYVAVLRPTWGPSMLPTISAYGDWVLISKLHRRGRGVQVGDMVSFRHPMRPEFNGLKRIIGMPGDIVARDTPGKGDGWLVQVPEGHCWVAGDNLEWSRDSRMFGPLPLALVRGKVVAMVRPELKWFKNALTDVEE